MASLLVYSRRIRIIPGQNTNLLAFFSSNTQQAPCDDRRRGRHSRRLDYSFRAPPPVFSVTLQSRSFGSSPKKNTESNKQDATPDAQESSSQVAPQPWWQQIQSIPNLITVGRIASTPLLSYLIISNQYELALAGCIFMGASDVLDGYIAKNYNMSTVLGSYLDPIADKLLINVLSVSLWYTGILPAPLVVLWLARDVALLSATGYHVATQITKSPLKVEPTVMSKVNTALQFATLSIGIIHPIYPIGSALVVLTWITGGTTIASGLGYIDFSAFHESGKKRSP